MTSIVFAKPAHLYASYADFWRLVELAGFATCRVDEIDLSKDRITITTPMNGDLVEHLNEEIAHTTEPWPGRVIWWNLEMHTTSRDSALDDAWPFIDAAWVSDLYLKGLDSRYVYLHVGSDDRLRDGPAWHRPPAYDVATMGYEDVPRRARVLAALRERGVRVAPLADGADRYDVLSRTRLMLNIGQQDTPVIAPLRTALAAAYELPMVTETLAVPHVFQNKVFQAPYASLVPEVLRVLSLPDKTLRKSGIALRTLLCQQWPFRYAVERALCAMKWKTGEYSGVRLPKRLTDRTLRSFSRVET